MAQKRILVVDDEVNLRWALKKALKDQPYEILEAEDGEQALEKYNNFSPDMILLDIRMPKKNGMDVLREIKIHDHSIPIIMLTAYGDTDSAIEALNIGAIDYLTKPFDIKQLKLLIKKVLKEDVQEFNFQKKIIGESKRIKEVLQKSQRVANSTATVLIYGESGTGKELIARAIYELSERKNAPFVAVNCGALPEALLESELFGHEKGAFTGATSRKLGRFERAQGGTIFLDEIGELSLAMQVKLLRVLQEKEIERVGGTRPIKVDVRVLAATNRNIKEMVDNDQFREDLYYRLNVFPIETPPLRERKEDIPLLVEFFIEKNAKNLNKPVKNINDITLALLKRYTWPGNIRELENVIERAVILSWGETITPEVLPRELINIETTNDQKSFILPEDGINLEEVEKHFIIQALQRANNNQTQAAKLLGISRHTLLYRMKKFNLSE